MRDLYEFRNGGNSVVIKDPVTPRPWLNYLWNVDVDSIILLVLMTGSIVITVLLIIKRKK